MAESADPDRIRAAWQGRISGCILGKPVEVLSFRQGLEGLTDYLARTGALPLRDYVPLEEGSTVDALGRDIVGEADAVKRLHEEYASLSPVHTLNNLALVVWALLSAGDDFGAAVGDAVAAGWDTDCNGATVGGLFGLAGQGIPEQWTRPWQGRVGVSLAGYSELTLDDLVTRTLRVAADLEAGHA